jgi:hypothetical protein
MYFTLNLLLLLLYFTSIYLIDSYNKNNVFFQCILHEKYIEKYMGKKYLKLK